MSTYVLLVSCTALLLVLATRRGEPAQTLRRASGSPQPIIFSSSMPQRKKRGKNPKHTFPSRPRHSLAPFPKPPVPSLSPACFLCALSRSQLFASVSVHKRVHTSHSLLSSPLHFATEPLPEAAIVAPEPRERLFAFSTYGASSSRLLVPGAARQRQCWRSCCSCTSSCSSLLLTRTAASTGAGGRCTSRSSRWRARPRPSSRSYPTARHRPRRRRRRRLATPPPPPPPAPATRRTLRRRLLAAPYGASQHFVLAALPPVSHSAPLRSFLSYHRLLIVLLLVAAVAAAVLTAALVYLLACRPFHEDKEEPAVHTKPNASPRTNLALYDGDQRGRGSTATVSSTSSPELRPMPPLPRQFQEPRMSVPSSSKAVLDAGTGDKRAPEGAPPPRPPPPPPPMPPAKDNRRAHAAAGPLAPPPPLPRAGNGSGWCNPPGSGPRRVQSTRRSHPGARTQTRTQTPLLCRS
jgi:hypothetical protein